MDILLSLNSHLKAAYENYIESLEPNAIDDTCDWDHRETCCIETVIGCRGKYCTREHQDTCTVKKFIQENS